jgi:hypothetical protein
MILGWGCGFVLGESLWLHQARQDKMKSCAMAGLLSTQMRPLWASMRRLTMARPRPPSTPALLPRDNNSNRWAWSWSAIPGPWSFTENCTSAPRSSLSSRIGGLAPGTLKPFWQGDLGSKKPPPFGKGGHFGPGGLGPASANVVSSRGSAVIIVSSHKHRDAGLGLQHLANLLRTDVRAIGFGFGQT